MREDISQEPKAADQEGGGKHLSEGPSEGVWGRCKRSSSGLVSEVKLVEAGINQDLGAVLVQATITNNLRLGGFKL